AQLLLQVRLVGGAHPEADAVLAPLPGALHGRVDDRRGVLLGLHLGSVDPAAEPRGVTHELQRTAPLLAVAGEPHPRGGGPLDLRDVHPLMLHRRNVLSRRGTGHTTTSASASRTAA